MPQVIHAASILDTSLYAWCDFMNALGTGKMAQHRGIADVKANPNLTQAPLTCLECARW